MKRQQAASGWKEGRAPLLPSPAGGSRGPWELPQVLYPLWSRMEALLWLEVFTLAAHSSDEEIPWKNWPVFNLVPPPSVHS